MSTSGEIIRRHWIDSSVSLCLAPSSEKILAQWRKVSQGSLLLVGPPSIGKTSVAIWLARGVCCQKGAAACQAPHCPSCTAFSKGIHPDIRIHWAIEGDSTVEQTRDLVRWSYQSPISRAGKIAMVFGLDRLNSASANTLLKLFEEPPGQCRFFCTASSRRRVMPTLRSRLPTVALPAISQERLWLWAINVLQLSQRSPLVDACWGRPGRLKSLWMKEESQEDLSIENLQKDLSMEQIERLLEFSRRTLRSTPPEQLYSTLERLRRIEYCLIGVQTHTSSDVLLSYVSSFTQHSQQ